MSEPTYTEDELANIDPPPFKFEGQMYTAYQATQKQREIERTIRKLKRLQASYTALGASDKATAATSRLLALNKKYSEFSKKAGLPEQRERMRVLYT